MLWVILSVLLLAELSVPYKLKVTGVMPLVYVVELVPDMVMTPVVVSFTSEVVVVVVLPNIKLRPALIAVEYPPEDIEAIISFIFFPKIIFPPSLLFAINVSTKCFTPLPAIVEIGLYILGVTLEVVVMVPTVEDSNFPKNYM